MHTSPRFTARLHRSIDEVRPIWMQLQAGGHLTAYQRLDWLESIATHLAIVSAKRVLFVEIQRRQEAGTVMLLPLVITRQLGVTIASWLDFGVCDYAAPVLASRVAFSPDEAAEAWAAALAVLPAVDLVDIRQIPPEIDGVLNPLVLLDHCRQTGEKTFGLALDGDAKTTLQRLLGAKGHRNILRRESKMAGRGVIRLVEPSSPAEIEDLFSTTVAQRRRRFRDMGRIDILERPEIESFYRDVALRSLREGGPAKLFGLAVGDELVATTYMLIHNGSMHGIILSIGGPEWHAFSPGLVVAVRMIEWAATHGLTYFDMTVGNMPYKSGLGAKPRMLHRLLEPRTALGSCAAAVLLSLAGAAEWMKSHPRLFQPLRSMRQRLRRLSIGRPLLRH